MAAALDSFTVFPRHFIENIYQRVSNPGLEICGNFRINQTQIHHETLSIMSTLDETEGIRDANGRSSCVPANKNSSQYLYHTHPLNSYAYPSKEDLWTCVKRRNNPPYSFVGHYYSYIFTQWGLFSIYPTGSAINEGDEVSMKRNFVNQIVHFHQQTKAGPHQSIPFSQQVHALIHAEYIPAAHQAFPNIQVYFTPWETMIQTMNIRNDLYLGRIKLKKKRKSKRSRKSKGRDGL